MKRPFFVPYNRIQEAMEDTRRDHYEYFLDLKNMEVITLQVLVLDDALKALYSDVPSEYEEGVELDSTINLNADLSHDHESTVELAVTVLLNDKRYIYIPERNSAEAFKTMASFAEVVSNHELRSALICALNGPGAFRRFKDILIPDKRMRKIWHGYNARAMKQVIDRWQRTLKEPVKPADEAGLFGSLN